MKSQRRNNILQNSLKRHIPSKSIPNTIPLNLRLIHYKKISIPSNYQNNNDDNKGQCQNSYSLRQTTNANSLTTDYTISKVVCDLKEYNKRKHKKHISLFSARDSIPFKADNQFYHSKQNNHRIPLSNRNNYDMYSQPMSPKDNTLFTRRNHTSPLRIERNRIEYNKHDIRKFKKGNISDHSDRHQHLQYQKNDRGNEYERILNEQHNIIQLYQKKINEMTEHSQAIKEENDTLKKKIIDAEICHHRIHLKNKHLVFSNKKLCNNKKEADNAICKESDYKRTISKLKQKLKDYHFKSLQPYTSRDKQIKSFDIVKQTNSHQLNPFDYNKIKEIQSKADLIKSEELIDKIQLLQTIIKEANHKIERYEKYFNSHNIDPASLFLMAKKKQSCNYDNLAIVNNWMPNTNTEDNIIFQNTEDDTSNQGNEIGVSEEEFFEILYVILKSLEAKNIPYEILSNRISQVYNQLSKQKNLESTKKEFIGSFVKVFIELLHLSQRNDITIIERFLFGLVDTVQENTGLFYSKLIEMFEDIHDYTQNDNELLVLRDKVKRTLLPFKEVITAYFSQKHSYMIKFKDFQTLIKQMKMGLDEESMEYMIYLMKQALQQSHSINDLTILPIIQLLNEEDKDEENQLNLSPSGSVSESL